MSVEVAASFFEHIQKRDDLVEKLKLASANDDEFCRLSAELGRQAGYEFEPSHVKDALVSIVERRQALSDERLDAVAGGWSSYLTSTTSSYTYTASQIFSLGVVIGPGVPGGPGGPGPS